MRVSGNRAFLSINTFSEIELPEFAVIIGLNGAGKSHFLQAIESGAIHSDVLGLTSNPPGVAVRGVRLLRNQDPSPQGLSNGLKSDPNELLARESSLEQHMVPNPAVLANIRQRMLLPLRERLEEAIGGSLSEIFTPPELALRLTFDEIFTLATEKGFISSREKLSSVFDAAGTETATSTVTDGVGDANQLRLVRLLAKNLNRPILSLSDEDLVRAGSWGQYELFDTDFVRIFLQYRDKKIRNAIRQGVGGDQAALALSSEQFTARWGEPPWERVSEVLAEFGLPYRVKEPSMDHNELVYFRLERADGVEVEFGNLSAGEKILIRFALSAFQFDEARVNVAIPKLLLLDEVDASLHPQNVHRLLDAIQSVFVKSMNVPVIMTTHSPTTVALVPEGAIFEMTEELRIPQPITKQQALNRLTTGVPTLAVDYSGRRQVFVESSVDAAQFDRLTNILKAELDLSRTLNFTSAGGSEGGDSRGGCTVVTRIVESLTANGIKSLFGLVDWDGKNDPSGSIRVLAHGTHYTKENLLLDPLLVSILLLLDKPPGIVFPLSLPQLNEAEPEKLQALSNVILERLNLQGDTAFNRYLSGLTLSVPAAYQMMKGHDLEVLLVTKFPALNRYSGGGKWLVDPIINRVIADFPNFCPMPLIEVFREIASEPPT